MKFSLTYSGVVTMLFGFVFTTAGVPFVEGDVQTTIATLTTFIGACVTLFGRWRVVGVNGVRDINLFGFRKQ